MSKLLEPGTPVLILRLNARRGTIIQVDPSDYSWPYLVTYDGGKKEWLGQRDVSVIPILPERKAVPHPARKHIIYVIGSLKNRDEVIETAHKLQQQTGWEFFADWTAPGPDADDYLRDMAKARGWDHIRTLDSYAAKHVAAFDKHHLDRADAALILLPCGKSCHMELGYMIGKGKPVYIHMPEAPERVDVMYNLIGDRGMISDELDPLLERMKRDL